MIKQLKRFIKFCLNTILRIVGKSAIGRHIQSLMATAIMENTLKVSCGSKEYVLTVPNALCVFRAENFATKEPETIEWIDSIPKGAVFWDVGANIGIFSVYAAKERGCRVWAFEPSVFNLECLARNTFLNNVTDRVCLVALALNEKSGCSDMHMTSTEWGGALSSFGQDFGFDGKKLDQIFLFSTIGVSMDDAVEKMEIPQPDFVKIDVDGIEHLVLRGGGKALSKVQGVLVEINDEFHDQADECKIILEGAGLVLKEKRHSDLIENSATLRHVFNQIWVRL